MESIYIMDNPEWIIWNFTIWKTKLIKTIFKINLSFMIHHSCYKLKIIRQIPSTFIKFKRITKSTKYVPSWTYDHLMCVSFPLICKQLYFISITNKRCYIMFQRCTFINLYLSPTFTNFKRRFVESSLETVFCILSFIISAAEFICYNNHQ